MTNRDGSPDADGGATTRRRNAMKSVPKAWAHGWGRVGDIAGAVPLPRLRRGSAPAGTSMLLGLLVLALCAAGIVRVRASARVLALGAEITELTDEQARLQEQKRRLLAERAYLRHPDQVAEIARGKLGMVPVEPSLVQQIRLVE
ncbi:MAG: septum formation initiator family protein [Nannocystaceae bacterium]|nr:septum formation initiator family protein [Nannocystaceae bacterium]